MLKLIEKCHFSEFVFNVFQVKSESISRGIEVLRFYAYNAGLKFFTLNLIHCFTTINCCQLQ